MVQSQQRVFWDTHKGEMKATATEPPEGVRSVHFWKMFGFFSFHASIWLKAKYGAMPRCFTSQASQGLPRHSMESKWKGPWLRPHPAPHRWDRGVQCVLSTVFSTQHCQLLGRAALVTQDVQPAHSFMRSSGQDQNHYPVPPNSLVSKKNSHHQEIPEWRHSQRDLEGSVTNLFLAGLLKTWT